MKFSQGYSLSLENAVVRTARRVLIPETYDNYGVCLFFTFLTSVQVMLINFGKWGRVFELIMGNIDISV